MKQSNFNEPKFDEADFDKIDFQESNFSEPTLQQHNFQELNLNHPNFNNQNNPNQYNYPYPPYNPNTPQPPEGFNIKASFSLKGKFAVFANVFLGIIMIIGIVATIFIFEYNFSEFSYLVNFLISLGLFLALLIGGSFFSLLIQIIFFKAGGYGKLKAHLGAVGAILTEKPMKIRFYILASMLSNIINLTVLALIAVFFWADWSFLVLLFLVGNWLANIPFYIFLFKQDKAHFVYLDKGNLTVLDKNQFSNSNNNMAEWNEKW
ncbi:MAG: hypothetical protein FWE13_04060 [Firmicutes bacterium]|nr:hypothetical protein [Bacillota bacterium]